MTDLRKTAKALQLADKLDKKWIGWKNNPTDEIKAADELRRLHEENERLRQALAQPEPTVEDNSQNWKGMDGAVAWHLIDRHADNWADIGKMMDEWLKANQAQPEQEPAAWQDPQYKTLIEPHKAHPDWIPLYTAPSKREWIDLTEDEAFACRGLDFFDTYKNINAKLKEKNT